MYCWLGSFFLDIDISVKLSYLIIYIYKTCAAHSVNENKVVVQGLDGYIVAEKHGLLLVCSLKEEQRIKEFGE